MTIDPKSAEGKKFFELYDDICRPIAATDGRKILVIPSQFKNCYASKDGMECITEGAAKIILRELKEEIEKQAAPRVDMPAPAAASASSSSSSSSAELPKMPETIEKIIGDFKADRETKANG